MTDKQAWERARLIPISGITGPDEQERRGVSALLAVINSVREFGRPITAPLGAPAGTPMAYIEVSFTSGEKKVRPDGVLQVKRGSTLWTALIEVKTGTNELKAAQVESYLDVCFQTSDSNSSDQRRVSAIDGGAEHSENLSQLGICPA